MTSAKFGALYREHLLLNASFDEPEDGVAPRPQSYPGSEPLSHVSEGAFLSDLTGSTYALVSGPAAQALCESAFCGRKLAVGECAFEASLLGDAAVTSVPLCIRTGDSEYVLLDPTERGETLVSWLGFLSGIKQDGFEPYKGARVDDASEMLVPLLLVGAEARAVLSDYVKSSSDLPAPGRVSQVRLDSILCVVCGLPLSARGITGYVVFAPKAQASVLWRSFLSFSQVSPAGTALVDKLMQAGLPWATSLAREGRIALAEGDLRSWGLLRAEADFVGARSLLSD